MLMSLAACLVGRLAAIDRRHLLLDALTEGGTALVLACLVGRLAVFALLRIAGLAAVEVLYFLLYALPALLTAKLPAGGKGLVAGFAASGAGARVGGLLAILWCTVAWAAIHYGASFGAHSTHFGTGLGADGQTEQGSQQGAGNSHQTDFHFFRSLS